MKTTIVLGMFFGDEGKGLTTSCLAQKNDLVVRFNGGQQAGHTVEKDGYRHIFSSFGAGTLNGAHTYLSEYCTVYPKSLYNEEQKLLEKTKVNIAHFMHPMTMVTTPFDIDHNRSTEVFNKHGSVGMGFGATIARNQNTPYKLYAVDLTYRDVVVSKLKQIAAYYNVASPQRDIDSFLEYTDAIELNICTLGEIKNRYSNIVFEGAQGIMLDMDFGFFPHVTRSNCTSKNAMQIIKDNNLPTPEIYYVMRSYLTRHGNGFMPNESAEVKYRDETNIAHNYQGKFRQGWHSKDMIDFSLACDNAFSAKCNKNLVVTCLNQTDSLVLIDNKYIPIECFVNQEKFDGYNIYTSYSKTSISRHSVRFIKHAELSLSI